MLTLRFYQEAAKQAFYGHLRTRDDNGCIVIPTGGGKTPVIASICHDVVHRWESRALVLTHVKELVEQSAAKLAEMSPGTGVGVYSAGLRRKELGYSVTVAGIQSVYQQAPKVGKVDIVLVDEAHLIPPDGDGMYQQFFRELRVVNPNVRVGGLTATPYRLKGGLICGPDRLLNHVCYEIGVRELIDRGFLCPLRTKAGRSRANLDEVHTRGGEFIAGELERACDTDVLVESAVAEIVAETKDRRSVLVFAAGVKHGEHIVQTFAERGIECGWVDGETPGLDRDATIDRFKRGDLKYLANVNVLTTGFDAPGVDCTAILRPTMSPGLYYQICGRGFRLSAGKSDCLVLDFGGNVMRHGPVDAIGDKIAARIADKKGAPPIKECPKCGEIIPRFESACPACGHEFPPPEMPTRGAAKHDATATDAGIITGQVTLREHEVRDVYVCVHHKGGDMSARPTMRVDYQVGLMETISEWVCFEHSGFAADRALEWWQRMTNEPLPKTVKEAAALVRAGAMAKVIGITLEHKAGEKFPRVVGWRFDGEKPARTSAPTREEVELDGLRTFLESTGGEFTAEDVAKAALPWCEEAGVPTEQLVAHIRAALIKAIVKGWSIALSATHYRSRIVSMEATEAEIPF